MVICSLEARFFAPLSKVRLTLCVLFLNILLCYQSNINLYKRFQLSRWSTLLKDILIALIGLSSRFCTGSVLHIPQNFQIHLFEHFLRKNCRNILIPSVKKHIWTDLTNLTGEYKLHGYRNDYFQSVRQNWGVLEEGDNCKFHTLQFLLQILYANYSPLKRPKKLNFEALLPTFKTGNKEVLFVHLQEMHEKRIKTVLENCWYWLASKVRAEWTVFWAGCSLTHVKDIW